MTNQKVDVIQQTVFLILIVIISYSCTSQNKKNIPPPNIIWLISEDNSPILRCYGDENATTPNLDKFAESSLRFENAFSNAPVCAPSRSTLISGMYASTMGTHNMRSNNPSPPFMKFFPYYLKRAGYFTSNRVKKDYNTIDQDSVWDISDWWGWNDALVGRKKDQPFFVMYNTWMSHEGKIHPGSKNWEYFSGTMSEHEVDSITYLKWWNDAKHDPEKMNIHPYHPKTEEVKNDYALYYDCVELMDREMGVVLEKLKEDNLLENSIIFYFSDHGGVLPRSKRFIFESGLNVPMLLYIPESYRHIFNYQEGTSTDRIVSFIDLAPTLLKIVGLEVPEYMQGKSMLNEESDEDFAFGFRGRMDERYDKVRSIRTKEYRYVRNYMPHRIYGGRVNYLWKAESAQSWENEYKSGNLDSIQSIFWNKKPFEELYNVKLDPHNIYNLVHDDEYQKVIQEMKNKLNNHLIESRDLFIFPESEMIKRYKGKTPYEIELPIEYSKILDIANKAIENNPNHLNLFIDGMTDAESLIRYWSVIGCTILEDKSNKVKSQLLKLINDKSNAVKIAVAEALFQLGEKSKAVDVLTKILMLPKLEKDDPSSENDLYSNHFAITEALNVIDALNIRNSKLDQLILQISKSERGKSKDYDKRIASNLVLRYQLK